MMRKLYMVIWLVIAAMVLPGCSGDKGPGEKQGAEVMVFAAASLTESLTELGKNFEKQEKDSVKISFNFAGSQALEASLENGARADLFISASTKYMEKLKTAGYVKEDKILLKNRLTLIKNRSSRYTVKSLGDLAADGLGIAIGEESVPVGEYWKKAFDKALKDGLITSDEGDKIKDNIKTKELNVKDVVSKVLLDAVDVGVVYKTDVTAANAEKLEEVDLPVFQQFDATYPAALLKESGNATAAAKFMEYLFSDKGKEVFKKYKFVVE